MQEVLAPFALEKMDIIYSSPLHLAVAHPAVDATVHGVIWKIVPYFLVKECSRSSHMVHVSGVSPQEYRTTGLFWEMTSSSSWVDSGHVLMCQFMEIRTFFLSFRV